MKPRLESELTLGLLDTRPAESQAELYGFKSRATRVPYVYNLSYLQVLYYST